MITRCPLILKLINIPEGEGKFTTLEDLEHLSLIIIFQIH